MRGLGSLALALVFGCGPQHSTGAESGEPRTTPAKLASSEPPDEPGTRGTEPRAVEGPPFPALAASEGPCPSGMVLVPGGGWTAKQAKRLATQTRTTGLQFDDHVSDFCFDLTEVTLGAVARCISAGTCKTSTSDAPDVDGDALARLRDGRDVARWREAWDAHAATPRSSVRPQDAIDTCRALGRRVPRIEEWLWVAWGGVEDRRHPWGSGAPGIAHLNICDSGCEERDTDDDGFPEKAPVGRFPAGVARWGALDMAGNVQEWVSTRPPKSQADADERFTFATACGRSHETKRSAFATEWAFPCHAAMDIRELAASPRTGFRCAAEPSVQVGKAR
jgi:formylglycine-generating enzyme required for sulfatase activity